MKNHFKIIVLVLSISMFISCDGFQAVDGMIIGSETHLPISNVVIKELKKGDTLATTDEQGYFEINQIKGFPIGDKELTIIVSKKEYIQDTITFINNESKLIKLTSLKNKY